MPDTFRAASGFDGAQRRGIAWRAVAGGGLAAWPGAAAADTLSGAIDALTLLEHHEVAALTLVLGIIVFAVYSAILLVRARTRAAALEQSAVSRLAEIDRLNGLLLSEPRVLVSWAAGADEPDIIGDTARIANTAEPRKVLDFAAWLDGDQARAMERAAEKLRAHGESFTKSLTTQAGRLVEADGRAIAGRAVMKLRDVSGIERALTELNARHDKVKSDADALRALIEALPSPVWVRDDTGSLVYVNPAYARAVEAPDAASAVERGIELLDRSAREELLRSSGEVGAAARVPAIVAGQRRILDVRIAPVPQGSAGIGIDTTEVGRLGDELDRMILAHRRTLDQLTTAVASFGADQKLKFHNAAYRTLWHLDPAFLDGEPTDSAVLDRLRADRKLPEQQDFRQWKAQLHQAYRAIEAKAQEWHLPNGHTLRVVTTPNPEGGVTYLFDDVTERLELTRRFEALINVQGETLDNLSEALAVFGSDGRVRLHNPAFARLWRFERDMLDARPHIEQVIERCRPLHGGEATWLKLRAAVTALETREPMSRRIERSDGVVLDCTTVPLPDGGTVVAFQDVTDSVNVERALRERTEALVEADKVKRSFVHHVSYELRTPLTNIIGFADFLSDPTTGPLTDRQRGYLGHITASTDTLLVLIDNILDLASVDAEAITLNLGKVDIRRTMEAAAEGVRDRLIRDGILLNIRADDGIGSFIADEQRVRQILFNLLSNAVGFSPKGEIVTFAAERRGGGLVFSVTDRGPGIPPEVKDKVFDLFETDSRGSSHRGSGLGLSIVRSFVELHGGSVAIDSEVGRGTTVVCTFPLEQALAMPAE